MTLRKLLVALIISRVLFAWLLVYTGASDRDKPEIGYYGLAQSLWHGSYSDPYVPEAVWPPAYPVLLMPAVASSHFLVLALGENIALTAFIGWMVWVITGTLLPGSPARAWALLLYCFETTGLFYAGMVQSETLFTALLLVFVLMFIRFLQSNRLGLCILAAVALAAATYTRAVSQYLGYVIVAVLLVQRRLSAALVFACVFAGLLAPWVVRNYIRYDYPAFSSAGAYNLYAWPEASIKAALSGQSVGQVHAELGFGNNDEQYFVRHPEQREWKLGRVYSYMASEALRTIAAHPLLYARIHLKGCTIVMLDPNRSGMWQMGFFSSNNLHLGQILNRNSLATYPLSVAVFATLGLELFLYYAAAVLGLRSLAPTTSVLIVLMIAYFVVVSGMPLAEARYRVPFMPLICIAASPAVAQLASWFRKRKSSAPPEPLAAVP